MTQYYKNADGYHGLSGEFPPGFKGVIEVGRGPEEDQGIDSVTERAYFTQEQGSDWEPVEPEDVPDDWFKAIGYDKRVVKPQTGAAPEPQIVAAPVEEFQGTFLEAVEALVNGEIQPSELSGDHRCLYNWNWAFMSGCRSDEDIIEEAGKVLAAAKRLRIDAATDDYTVLGGLLKGTTRAPSKFRPIPLILWTVAIVALIIIFSL